MTKKLSAILPDLTPLRTLREFRLLWIQGLVTYFGSSMAMIALPLQIKDLTNSPLAVGAMGAVELIPLIVFGLYGGALADAVDRRKLILLSEAGLGLLAVVLLINALLRGRRSGRCTSWPRASPRWRASSGPRWTP